MRTMIRERRTITMTEGMRPRVLTAEELKALPRLAIVFIEYYDGEQRRAQETMLAAMKCADGTLVDEDACVYADFEKDMQPNRFDGSRWRFWSGMPDRKLRKDTRWVSEDEMGR